MVSLSSIFTPTYPWYPYHVVVLWLTSLLINSRDPVFSSSLPHQWVWKSSSSSGGGLFITGSRVPCSDFIRLEWEERGKIEDSPWVIRLVDLRSSVPSRQLHQVSSVGGPRVLTLFSYLSPSPLRLPSICRNGTQKPKQKNFCFNPFCGNGRRTKTDSVWVKDFQWSIRPKVRGTSR